MAIVVFTKILCIFTVHKSTTYYRWREDACDKREV
jgi:hypothetical protein